MSQAEKILKARAVALAEEPVKEKATGARIHVVSFLLACERYGIESEYVRGVHPLVDLAPLPCTPAFVLGIINLHGRILSVLDLKKFFNLPEKGLADLNKVMVLSSNGMEFGILADAVLEVRTIPLYEIQPPPLMLTGIGAEYLRGVTRERMIVLDAQKILSDERIVVNDEIKM